MKRWEGRQSTNIEDRRDPRDLTKPYPQLTDPTAISTDRARADRFRATTAAEPLEQYDPRQFKSHKRQKVLAGTLDAMRRK